MVRAAKWWIPTAAMMLLSLLSYVDRNILALLANTILRDTRITAEQYGWIVSAFSAAYLASNPVWGRALDRFGVGATLACAVTLWTCASVAHAFATTAVAFAVARAALGLGEGATFPAGLRTATQTLRPDQHARGVALAYSGGSLGAVVTPLLVTPLALRWGWRGAFLVTGLFGTAWLAAWAWISRDARLRRNTAAVAATRPRLSDRSLWGFMAAYALGGLPLGFVLYGAPLYLGRRLGCDQATLGHVLWIPPLGWEAGYFFWGWVLDRTARRGRLDSTFFGPVFALLAALAVPLAAAPFMRSLPGVLTLLFFAMFVAGGFVIVSLSEATRRHTTKNAAFLAGLGAGSWSAAMALVMPVFGRLFDHGRYAAAYAIAAGAPVLGWLGWRALRPPSGETPGPTAT